MTPLLEARGICVSYGKAEAVRGVDLRIGAGQVVCVIGPNGAGKSSLLQALMGALPSRGSVSFDGVETAGTSLESRVERGLALVPEGRALFGEMTVGDNLLLGGFGRRRDGRAARRAALEEVYVQFPRLRERASQLANTLSGGERQMLAVARALLGQPRLLMLDEPSLGLAPRIVRDVMRMVGELRQRGVSVLLVEQNARAALAVSDYGYVIELGVIVAQAPAAELKSSQHVIDVYLGTGR